MLDIILNIIAYVTVGIISLAIIGGIVMVIKENIRDIAAILIGLGLFVLFIFSLNRVFGN